jgi:taurine dioxygenase
MNAPFEVKRLSGALGAEILGVDLAGDLNSELVAAIRRVWLEHLVVFFRDQELSSSQYLAFARTLGEPIEYPFLKGLPDTPEIIPVLKLEHERVNFGGIWHSDTAYLERPPMASMLIAREVPDAGGDTEFANMYLAYDTLSDGMKRLLDPLVAVNTSALADASKTREDRLRDNARTDTAKEYVAEHPVVRVHPETGLRALYVSVAHTERFTGMTRDESLPMLQFLHRHQTRGEFTCRFRWRPASIAVWDNRCTQHNAINDYQGQRRLMHRISLAGDRPRGPATR